MDLNRYNQLIQLLQNTDDQATDNCRENETFTQIKSIFEASNNPNASDSSIDWKRLENLSFEFLSANKKDILVGCYLSAALLHTHKLEGLEVGLKILNIMVKDHWDFIYPPLKRINGRWAAIEWLGTQLSSFIKDNNTTYPESNINNIKRELENLDANLSLVNDAPPNLLYLMNLFNNLKITPNQEAKTPPGTKELTPDPINHNQAAQKTTSINSIQEALARVTELFTELDSISDYIISHKDAELVELSLAYKLSRFSVWKTIDNLPIYDEQYKTRVPAPDKSLVAELKHLEDDQNYTTIINIIEQRFKDYPFWLDLHFSLYNALIANNNAEIATIIKNECRGFILKFPKLEKLCFADGSQMVNSQTYSWLTDDLSIGETQLHDNNNTSSSSNDEFSMQLMQLADQPKATRVDFLIKTYQDYAYQLSHYQKIDFYITLINELLSSSRQDLLNIYVNILEKDFDFYHLDSLDKALAIKALQAIIQAKKILNQNYTPNFSLLCELDMQAGLAI